MKRGLSQTGFTIVETMIFLAVSSAILVGALTLVSGMQNKTAFRNAVNDFEQQLTTLSTNVANGHYPRNDNVTCAPDPDSAKQSVLIGTGAGVLGTQKDCIFIGRVAQFTRDEGTFKVYNIVGRRQTGGVPNKEVEKLQESWATVINSPHMQPQEIRLQNGSEIIGVKIGSTPPSEIGSFGFLTTFNTYDGDQLRSGALRTNFFGVEGSSLAPSPDAASQLAATFKNKRADLGGADSKDYLNPAGGIEICLKSGSSNQVAHIILGGQNKTSSTSFTILEKAECWT